MDSNKYALLFEGGRLRSTDFAAQFSIRELALLRIVSGRIVACDVVEGSSTPPFSRKVPNGDHPVVVSVATFDSDQDQRVAAAMVRFGAGSPVRFERALVQGSEEYTFSIDSSMGCYLDERTLQMLDEMSDAEDEKLVEQLDQQFGRNQVDTWSWTSLLIDPSSGLNVVSFSTGWGDDDYESWFGFAEGSNEPVCLISDFRLVEDD